MTGIAINQNAILKVFANRAQFDVDELAEASGVKRYEAIKAAGMLINRGFMDRVERGVFVLTDTGKQALADGVEIHSGPMGPDTAIARPPVKDTLRQRAWNAMRIMGNFSTNEIALLTCDDPSDKDQKNIQRYCKGLMAAGFLALLPTRERGTSMTSNGFLRYRLIKDTGDIAPSHRVRKKDVFDHNDREAHPCL